MKRSIRILLLCVCAMLTATTSHAAQKAARFSFSVIGERASADDARLVDSIHHAARAHASFIVVNGIRPQQEACSDEVYQRRAKLLDETDRPVIVSIAARDWAECVNEKGNSTAQERLNFLRGSLFESDQARHAKSLTLVHQSTATKFRNYTENVRWESGGVLFATINLPANNNHYLADAGRNNEFEDRLNANRHWLQRIFTQARSHKLKGLVLFADGNPLLAPSKSTRSDRRDGFAEMRKELGALAAKYPGKVLLVHGQQASGNITWRDNLGVVGIGKASYAIDVKPGAAAMFSVRRIGNAKR